MTLLFIDGFDHYDDGQIIDKWAFSSLGSVVASSRFGGYCLRCGVHSAYVYRNIPARNELFCGTAFYTDELPHTYNTSNPMIVFKGPDDTTQVKIYISIDQKIYVLNSDNTVLGSTAALITISKWVYLEFRVKVHATLGEVEVRVNEQQALNLSGVDTLGAGADTIGRLGLSGVYYNKPAFFDDLYIDDAQFHGNVRIRTIMPDADGTHTDFERSAGAADYECVDETLTNEDTDYIKSVTKGHKSTFGITTGAIGVVKGIQINHHLKAATSGLRRIKPLVRSGGADYNSPVSGIVDASYKYKLALFQTDPQDDAAWNQTKLEAAEFGLLLVDGTTTTTTSTTTTAP